MAADGAAPSQNLIDDPRRAQAARQRLPVLPACPSLSEEDAAGLRAAGSGCSEARRTALGGALAGRFKGISTYVHVPVGGAERAAARAQLVRACSWPGRGGY